jgi:hypothetical protein
MHDKQYSDITRHATVIMVLNPRSRLHINHDLGIEGYHPNKPLLDRAIFRTLLVGGLSVSINAAVRGPLKPPTRKVAPNVNR